MEKRVINMIDSNYYESIDTVIMTNARDKNDQLDGITRLISNSCEEHGFALKECEIDLIALDLYSNGYLRINCDDYVTIEWHNEQIAHAEDEIESLKAKIVGLICKDDTKLRDLKVRNMELEERCELLQQDLVKQRKKLEKQARKAKTEAVREFAEKLKARARGLTLDGGDGKQTNSHIGNLILTNDIDKLLRGYEE